MKGYRVKSGDGTGYYGFEDSYSEANSLLSICLQHDPNATIEPYEYESQAEKNYRLEQENATLKKALDEANRKLYSACAEILKRQEIEELASQFQNDHRSDKEREMEEEYARLDRLIQQAQEQERKK